MYMFIYIYIYILSCIAILEEIEYSFLMGFFDPVDRIWIRRCVEPSVHSKLVSSTIFYLWVGKMIFIFEKPGSLSTPGWLGFYLLRDGYIYIYMHICYPPPKT